LLKAKPRRGLPENLLAAKECALQGDMLIGNAFTCSCSFSIETWPDNGPGGVSRKSLMAAKPCVLGNDMLINNSFTCSSDFCCCIMFFQTMQHLLCETTTFEGQGGLTRVPEKSAEGVYGNQTMCFTR
jgi:hypothetical protein